MIIVAVVVIVVVVIILVIAVVTQLVIITVCEHSEHDLHMMSRFTFTINTETPNNIRLVLLLQLVECVALAIRLLLLQLVDCTALAIRTNNIRQPTVTNNKT